MRFSPIQALLSLLLLSTVGIQAASTTTTKTSTTTSTSTSTATASACGAPLPTAIPNTATSGVISSKVCPKGYALFYHESLGFVPNVQPLAIWTVIGNFFDLSWQGLTLVSTVGLLNALNSVRYFQFGTTVASEKLTCSYGSLPSLTYPASVAATQTQFVQVFGIQGSVYTPEFDTTVVNVTDYLTAFALNGGTQIVWYVGGCSTNTTASISVFSQVHDAAVAGVVAGFA